MKHQGSMVEMAAEMVAVVSATAPDRVVAAAEGMDAAEHIRFGSLGQSEENGGGVRQDW